jgi:hypothetical protein
MTVPLLDTSSNALPAVSVDWGLVALAALVAAVVAVALCCGEPLRSRRQVLRALARGRLASALVLAFVVLPNALPLDHALSPAHRHMHPSQAEESVHASHCHVTPGSCSDVPLASGPGQFLHAEAMLPAGPALTVRVEAAAVALPSNNGITPDTPPPRA